MRMDDPYPTFSHLVTQIRQLYPRFAYIHILEPRAAGGQDRVPLPGESNDFLRAIWNVPESTGNGSAFISSGGYNRQLAFKVAEEKGDILAFGRHFIPNVSSRSDYCQLKNSGANICVSPIYQPASSRTYHLHHMIARHSTLRPRSVTRTGSLRIRKRR